jgi:hypothetical protein
MLAGCAHAVDLAAPYSTTFLTALVLAGPGPGWSVWKYVQLTHAGAVSSDQQYQAAYDGRAQRAAGHEQGWPVGVARLNFRPGQRSGLPSVPVRSALRKAGRTVAGLPGTRRLASADANVLQ